MLFHNTYKMCMQVATCICHFPIVHSCILECQYSPFMKSVCFFEKYSVLLLHQVASRHSYKHSFHTSPILGQLIWFCLTSMIISWVGPIIDDISITQSFLQSDALYTEPQTKYFPIFFSLPRVVLDIIFIICVVSSNTLWKMTF